MPAHLHAARIRRETKRQGERWAYVNVNMMFADGEIPIEVGVLDTGSDESILKAAGDRLIRLFKDATAELERTPLALL
jgi:hypothetical protein